MSNSYYCTVGCDNTQRSLDGKIVCGDAFCVFCRERWNISQEKLTVCINFFNSKEVATKYPDKYAEAAKNLEATSFNLLEETIKKVKLKELKGELNSRRLL